MKSDQPERSIRHATCLFVYNAYKNPHTIQKSTHDTTQTPHLCRQQNTKVYTRYHTNSTSQSDTPIQKST